MAGAMENAPAPLAMLIPLEPVVSVYPSFKSVAGLAVVILIPNTLAFAPNVIPSWSAANALLAERYTISVPTGLCTLVPVPLASVTQFAADHAFGAPPSTPPRQYNPV
jgi:hypothetical protein